MFSCNTRSSMDCISNDIVPISSRNNVPPFAMSKKPGLAVSAPVKAPFSCPNSMEGARSRGRMLQLTATNGIPTRPLFSWMLWATDSLPVPLAPSISTDMSEGATSLAYLSTSSILGQVRLNRSFGFVRTVASGRNISSASSSRCSRCTGLGR